MKAILWNLIGLFGMISLGHAQTDPAAKAILDKVSDTYQHYKTIQSDFSFSIENPGQAKSSTNGKLTLETSSGKYKVVLGSQEFVSDGKIQWTVMNDQDEVQINTVDNDNSTLNPTNIFTFYKTGYKSVSMGSSSADNKSLYAIELVPLETKQNVFKIKMRIDKANNLIYDATVLDKSGGKYTYTIHHTITDKEIPSGSFVFNKSNYSGMEIVDLR